MNAQNILLSLDKPLEVDKNFDGEITVCYRDCDIKESIFLIGTFGIGKTFDEACEDYLKQLHGATLVFNAYGGRREEIRVL